jgi:hypothetical protein
MMYLKSRQEKLFVAFCGWRSPAVVAVFSFVFPDTCGIRFRVSFTWSMVQRTQARLNERVTTCFCFALQSCKFVIFREQTKPPVMSGERIEFNLIEGVRECREEISPGSEVRMM